MLSFEEKYLLFFWGGGDDGPVLDELLWWGVSNPATVGCSDQFTITEPSGGWLRTFDPNTDGVGEFMDLVATMANDYGGAEQTYTITEPTAGWNRSYNASTDTYATMWATAATLATELFGTSNEYTVVPVALQTTFNPNTGTVNEARDTLTTLILIAKTDGVIG